MRGSWDQFASDLDYTLDTSPVYYQPVDSSFYFKDGVHTLVYRTDTKEPLIVVDKPGFRLRQPGEVKDYMNGYAQQLQGEITTVGTIANGRSYWGLGTSTYLPKGAGEPVINMWLPCTKWGKLRVAPMLYLHDSQVLIPCRLGYYEDGKEFYDMRVADRSDQVRPLVHQLMHSAWYRTQRLLIETMTMYDYDAEEFFREVFESRYKHDQKSDLPKKNTADLMQRVQGEETLFDLIVLVGEFYHDVNRFGPWVNKESYNPLIFNRSVLTHTHHAMKVAEDYAAEFVCKLADE